MGLVSPQFHCVFNDWFETVKNEPNDTSLWQHKAHFRKHASDKTNNLLISTPTNAQAPTPRSTPTNAQAPTPRSTPTNAQAPTPRLPPYASEIPATLLQLPDLSVPQANNEPDQVLIPEAPEGPTSCS